MVGHISAAPRIHDVKFIFVNIRLLCVEAKIYTFIGSLIQYHSFRAVPVIRIEVGGLDCGLSRVKIICRHGFIYIGFHIGVEVSRNKYGIALFLKRIYLGQKNLYLLLSYLSAVNVKVRIDVNIFGSRFLILKHSPRRRYIIFRAKPL